MENLKGIIKDIEELRGSTVRVFGQPQQINNEVSPYIIDVVNVLNSLKRYEVDYEITMYNEQLDEHEEIVASSVEEYLDYLNSVHGIEEVYHSNTYNYGANISNDIDYKIYKSGDGYFYVQIMVHRFGDVRSNYTEYAILQFNYQDEFIQTVAENYQVDTVTIGEIDFSLYICPLSESIEISCNDDDEVIGNIYGYYETEEEVISDIKDLLIEA